MSYQAAIFDRDGVLTYFDVEAANAAFAWLSGTSAMGLAARWKGYGERTGWPADSAQEQEFFTRFWDHVADDLGLPPAERARLHAVRYTDFVRAFPDARPALQAARAAGLRTGVLSNFSLATLDESLAAAGLAGLVDAACAATVIGAAKPAAAAYAAAAAALGVKPEDCLFFDDEPDCVEGARAAGMAAYLVDRRAQPGAALPAGVVADLRGLGNML